MSDEILEIEGCILDEAETETTCQALDDAGHEVEFAQATDLQGHWERLISRGVTGVFLWDTEHERLGVVGADYQRRGTCVGRGTYRAIQQSYIYSITSGTEYGVPVKLAYEPIYIGSREVIGGGRLSGDGSVGAWAARWVSEYGVVARAKYDSVDLTKSNESYSVKTKRIGSDVIEEGKRHTVAAHLCRTSDDIADAIAGGFGIARCHSTIYGNRNGNGESSPSRSGAHCQAIVGVYVRPDGSTGYVEQQSWGSRNPGGPSILKTKRRAGTTSCRVLRYHPQKSGLRQKPIEVVRSMGLLRSTRRRFPRLRKALP